MHVSPRLSPVLAMAILAAAGVVGATLPAHADELAEQSRTVFDANRDAVVTITMVISVSYEGNERENESEANGTLIGPDGLTVLSLTAVDPTVQYERTPDMGGELVSKVKDMRIVLADGSELPAEVVLRDRELDLAFVRPTSPVASAMKYVDLNSASTPRVLDPVVVLAQLGKVARRAHSAFVDRVETVVEKPRLFYVLGQHRSQSVMCSPVFGLDGGIVGIGVIRAIRGGQGGGFEDAMVIVVPAEDIRAASQQVPPPGEKAPDEQPTEAPAEPAADAETEAAPADAAVATE